MRSNPASVNDQHGSENPTSSRSSALIALLALSQATLPLSLDLTLPATPEVARQLGADQASIQTIFSGFLIVFGCGQLIWGPIGDRFGRKDPWLAGSLFFILGCAGCALSNSTAALLSARLLQAFGACSAMVLGSAMVRDLYFGAEEVRLRSLLMLLGSAIPISAPLLGGQIVTYSNWRDIFWTQAAIGVVMLVLVARSMESLPSEKRVRPKATEMALNYARLLANRRYLGGTLTGTFMSSSYIAYLTASPFVYIQYFKVTPQTFGWFTAINIAGMMLGSALGRKLVNQYGPARLLLTGVVIGTFSSFWLLIVGLTGWHGLISIIPPIFLCSAIVGVTNPNAIAIALSHFPESAGAAAAMFGALIMGVGGLAGALVGLWADGTPLAMAKVMALFSMLGLVSFLFLLKTPSGKK